MGKIKGVDVIYVMSGELTVRKSNLSTEFCIFIFSFLLHAGMIVQIIVDMFDIKGLVHYGIAGSSNNSLNVGDVSIMEHVSFTGSWKWKVTFSVLVSSYNKLNGTELNKLYYDTVVISFQYPDFLIFLKFEGI